MTTFYKGIFAVIFNFIEVSCVLDLNSDLDLYICLATELSSPACQGKLSL